LAACVLCSPWFASLRDRDRALFAGVVHLAGVFDVRPLVGTSITQPLGPLTYEEALK